jgi:hypothetical protein
MTIRRKKSCAFPNEFAGEKDAVQPILYSLFRALSGIEKNENRGRGDIRRKRRDEPGTTGSRRLMDYEPCFLGSFAPILLPHQFTLAIEATNIARKNKKAKAMHSEIVKQLTGYMGKRLLIAFELGNVVVDAKATGVLVTPVYVQVLCLELINMGTENVKLKLKKTKLFPLVSLKVFNRIVLDKTNKEFFNEKLFRGPDNEPAITEGLKVMWALMHASEKSIGGSFLTIPKQVQRFMGSAITPVQQRNIPNKQQHF